MRQLEDDLWTDLTESQEKVLDFIEDCIIKNQIPPTRAEICRFLGWRSRNAAQEVLMALAKKGRIVVFQHISRGIQLVKA